MLVEDVVTTGGSTIKALEALRDEGHQVCGVLAICDRLAGGAEAIEQAAGAPFVALTTIDDVYPERPDRCGVDRVRNVRVRALPARPLVAVCRRGGPWAIRRPAARSETPRRAADQVARQPRHG